MRWTLFSLVSASIFAACLAGCTSINSTLLTRNESNTNWERHPHLHGVPITLKVPTHLKVYLYQKHFFYASEMGMRRLELPFVVSDLSYEFIETEKIFTVDFKRPPAGTFNLRVDMTADEQYFQQIQHDVYDTTIEDVTTLLGSIAKKGLLAAPVSTELNTGGITDKELKEVTSIAAVQMFEIDDPQFEQKVTEFINCHLNNAHDAFVVPPSINSINRLSVPEKEHDTDICKGIFELPAPPQHPKNRLPKTSARPSSYTKGTYKIRN